MERQDFINTINDLRSTIESLSLTIATLLRTIESLHDGEVSSHFRPYCM